MKKLIFIIALVVLISGVYFIFNETPVEQIKQDQDLSAAPPASLPSVSPTIVSSSGTSPIAASSTIFSLSEVARHGTSADCWTAIRGQVYDLTEWIAKHPGGASAIIALCGLDGTEKFVKQHSGKTKPEAALEKLKIGSLAS